MFIFWLSLQSSNDLNLAQGEVVLSDFNIMEEAGGAGRNITREFKNVTVSGSTLEIHLYWTGKGTNALPQRGVYGPLISGITVTPSNCFSYIRIFPIFSCQLVL